VLLAVAMGAGRVIAAGRKTAGLDTLARWGGARHTSLDETAVWLKEKGAAILHAAREAVTGRNLVAKNPDGLVVEYFEAALSSPLPSAAGRSRRPLNRGFLNVV
jgi:hypothetical protein